jgi:uroporphyrinogen-III decarboxylase
VDTDGCLKQLVEWFAECGVNLIGPNEVRAHNDLVTYRQNMGQQMAFFGGLDKLTLLDGREAIDQMLARTIPPMKRTGGGWIVSLDHRVVRGTRLADFWHFVARVREMAAY